MMDAKKFIIERERMCGYQDDGCKKCPAFSIDHCSVYSGSIDDTIKMVDIVEKWASEHPFKTRQSEFLKQFTKANVDENSVLRICPNYIDSTVKCYANGDCDVCREKYWNEVVE
jgi:hypothetical protein